MGLRVSHWFSPFPLDAELLRLLKAAGLRRHKGDPAAAEGALVLIYRHPAALLQHWQSSDAGPISAKTLQKKFDQLLSHRSRGPLVADWRLRGLENDDLSRWIDGDGNPKTIATVPTIPPLNRLVLLELFRSLPDLYSAYLDLEVQAELFGGHADSDLMQQLQHRGDIDSLLKDWCSSSQTQGDWTTDDERTRRLEAELEHYLLLSREQQKMLKEQNTIGDRALQLASATADAAASP